MSTDGVGLHQIITIVQSWSQSDDLRLKELFNKFASIYDVSCDSGHVIIPDSLESKVLSWMNHLPPEEALTAIANQTIISVCNKVLEVESTFNELRQKRPRPNNEKKQGSSVDLFTKEASQVCDFCSYKSLTAEDVPFGRIETEHAITAANVFKIEAWNSIVIFRNHHPLNWTQEEFMDATLNTATQWFSRVHTATSDHCYPCISWDLLPNGGASQLHTHFHVILTKDRYPGGLDVYVRRAEGYKYKNESYHRVVTELHEQLGLCTRFRNAIALTSLTPVKDNEVLILCDESCPSDFYRLLYHVIRAFIDDMQQYGFSLAIALPSFLKTRENNRMTSFVGRIVTRGPLNFISSDVGSLDLFMAPCIGSNPFTTANFIHERVKKVLQEEEQWSLC